MMMSSSTSNHYWLTLQETFTSLTLSQLKTQSRSLKKKLPISSRNKNRLQITTNFNFSDSQLAFVNTFKSYLETVAGVPLSERRTKCFLVLGPPGSGKTVVLHEVARLIDEQDIGHSCIISTHFGILSSHLRCSTLYSLFKLCKHDSLKLVAECEPPEAVKECFQFVSTLCIDEVSLLTARWIRFLDLYLRRITGQKSKPFGNISILLFGDLNQLLPVMGLPLYFPLEQSQDTFDYQGYVTYLQTFNKGFFISGSQRVMGGDVLVAGTEEVTQKRVAFLKLLHNLRIKELDEDDIELLRSRFYDNVTEEERELFKDAKALFPYRVLVRGYNDMALTKLNVPLLKLSPKVTPKRFRNVIGGTEGDVKLASGCEIILTKNINVDYGLCNGTKATFLCPFYSNSSKAVEDPDCILVRLKEDHPYEPLRSEVIPVFPESEYMASASGESIKIVSFFVSAGYSFTQFKSQGLTFEKIIVTLGNNNKESFVNGTLTVLSRVRRLEDIIILEHPTFNFPAWIGSPNFRRHFGALKDEYDRLGISHTMGPFNNGGAALGRL